MGKKSIKLTERDRWHTNQSNATKDKPIKVHDDGIDGSSKEEYDESVKLHHLVKPSLEENSMVSDAKQTPRNGMQGVYHPSN